MKALNLIHSNPKNVKMKMKTQTRNLRKLVGVFIVESSCLFDCFREQPKITLFLIILFLEHRRAMGGIVTKHDSLISERKNARNVEQV